MTMNSSDKPGQVQDRMNHLLGTNMCIHDWTYDDVLLLTSPPQVDRICFKCFKRERVVETRNADELTFKQLDAIAKSRGK